MKTQVTSTNYYNLKTVLGRQFSIKVYLLIFGLMGIKINFWTRGLSDSWEDPALTRMSMALTPWYANRSSGDSPAIKWAMISSDSP